MANRRHIRGAAADRRADEDAVRRSRRSRNIGNMVGSWSFLVGVVLAVIFALTGVYSEVIMWILVVIGIIVGFLNIADEESEPFLISGAVLIIASAFGRDILGISELFRRVLEAMLLIFVPATIIVAIKNVFNLARRY
jgi:uncharacterized membrane protein